MCMRASNRNGGLLLLVAGFALSLILAVHCDGGGGGVEVQWQILTKLNYSSQIRLHPSLLLLVTVPWSGESRSLMKQLTHAVASDEVRFGTLKLMVLYKNVERALADALGATDEISIIYYHHTFSYKYHGRFRVQNILSSVQHVMSYSSDELILKSLTTPEDLRDFVESTDKAVFLLEFCGWTSRLLMMNQTVTGTDLGKDNLGGGLEKGNNGTLAQEKEDNMKCVGTEKLTCDIDNGYCGISWLDQFTTGNSSVLRDDENMNFTAGDSCTLHEFQRFEVFFEKLVTLVREFFLCPERVRFAAIHERSLLPWLHVKEPDPWLMTVHVAGCPSCSKILKEVDDPRNVLQSQVSPVLELEDASLSAETTLPAKRPAMVLFVDRSSNSMQVRRDSQEALKAFRELAQYTETSNKIHGQGTSKFDRSSTETESKSAIKHPQLQPFSASEKLIAKDKVSVVVMNDGQQFTIENLVSNLQGGSVQDVINYVLNQKKKRTLSSLVKDKGFQLLSEDFDIEVVESLPSNRDDQSNLGVGEPVGGSVESGDKDIPAVSSSTLQEELPDPSDVENTILKGNEEPFGRSNLSSIEPEQTNHGADIAADTTEDWNAGEIGRSKTNENVAVHTAEAWNAGETGLSEIDENVASDPAEGWKTGERRHPKMNENAAADTDEDLIAEETGQSVTNENEQQKYFTGSFFVYDGQYRFLETLTGGSKIPSVVMIDPNSQEHYVLAEQSDFSYSSLSAFVDDFLTGKLHPYLKSADMFPSLRESPRPPFVNLDFHETDPIPIVTTHTFSELVFGNMSDLKNSDRSSDRNVLVLFSNSWCGFCQRMELIVREVYRAVKAYSGTMNHASRKNRSMLKEYVEDVKLKLPLIYKMDCTQNDCGSIIKPVVQRELYPVLLLFPAERKHNSVSYEGDITVIDIIKFLAAHGSHVLDIIIDKSLLQDENLVEQGLQSRNLQHEVLLKDRLQNKYEITAQLPFGLHERPQLAVGCILSATEKLFDAHPFDESKVLIVKADQTTGFQGLIFNKHISWKNAEELVQGFEFLNEGPLSFGGPVMKRGMPLVALTLRYHEGQSVEVLPGVYFLDQSAAISLVEELRSGNQSVYNYWFFLGYSSWGWEQLFHEIVQGAWNVSRGCAEQLEWPGH